MIIETAIVSVAAIIVASLMTANAIHKRTLVDDMALDDRDGLKIYPFQNPAHDCLICGQRTHAMICEGFRDNTLGWKCPKCGGRYRTRPKTAA